jgi:hypothetical protein
MILAIQASCLILGDPGGILVVMILSIQRTILAVRDTFLVMIPGGSLVVMIPMTFTIPRKIPVLPNDILPKGHLISNEHVPYVEKRKECSRFAHVEKFTIVVKHINQLIGRLTGLLRITRRKESKTKRKGRKERRGKQRKGKAGLNERGDSCVGN